MDNAPLISVRYMSIYDIKAQVDKQINIIPNLKQGIGFVYAMVELTCIFRSRPAQNAEQAIITK